jgi:hypothetical protein
LGDSENLFFAQGRAKIKLVEACGKVPGQAIKLFSTEFKSFSELPQVKRLSFG